MTLELCSLRSSKNFADSKCNCVTVSLRHTVMGGFKRSSFNISNKSEINEKKPCFALILLVILHRQTSCRRYAI